MSISSPIVVAGNMDNVQDILVATTAERTILKT